MKNFFFSVLKMFIFFFCVFAGLGFLMDRSGCTQAFEMGFEDGDFSPSKVKEDSFLVMELNGVIMDGEKFLKDLRKYSEKDEVKAVIVRVNSPGGVVGPSQEIYSELKRVREELKKPVIISCNGVAASGAYYAALGGNVIFANPGTLMGSIGVIMEFANMQELYQWAKIKPFAITSGTLKNAGAAYKEMNEEDKLYFQGLVDEVYTQFKEAVQTERKLDDEVIRINTDGRVFNGKTAVALGFADKLGTFTDAVNYAQELTEMTEKPNLLYPKDRKKKFFEILTESRFITGLFKDKLFEERLKILGKPLYLMPGAFSF